MIGVKKRRASEGLTVQNFNELFLSEKACRDYLFQARWPNGYSCPRCGNTRGCFIKTRPVIQCLKCDFQAYLTAGTVMHATRQPLNVWFWAAYEMATNSTGLSAMNLYRRSGFNRYEPAFHMLHKLRASIDQQLMRKLSDVVEGDETFVGGESHGGKRGRGAPGKTIVVAAVQVEHGAKRDYITGIRLRAIPSASAKHLMKFIVERIEEGSTVKTDGHAGYNPVGGSGYSHEVTSELTYIHRMFSNLKTWIRGTHRYVSRKHMQAYLNEFAYRFSCRHDIELAFARILQLATDHLGPTYRQLHKAGSRGGWVHRNPPDHEQ